MTKPEIVLVKPEKPVSEMTAEERRALARRVVKALRASSLRQSDPDA